MIEVAIALVAFGAGFIAGAVWIIRKAWSEYAEEVCDDWDSY